MEADEDIIQNIIDKNIVHTLLKFLEDEKNPHLIYESAWCIANLSSGNKHQIQSMIDRGLFKYLLLILNSPHVKIYEQGAWIVGNISADADIFRRKLIQMDVIQILSSKLENTEDFDIISFTTWALTNLIRGKSVDKQKEKRAMVPLLKVIVEIDAEETLYQALIGANDIMNETMIDLMIEAKIPERLYVIAQRNVTSQLYAICQILSHISYGSYNQSNKIIECGFLPILFNILKNNVYSAPFKKEVLWTLSNLTIGEPDQIRAVLSDIDRFNTLMALCKHDNNTVRREAIWTICNVTNSGTKAEIQSLIDNGVLAMFDYNLTMDQDEKILKTILEALDNILDIDKDWDRSQDHPLYDLMEENHLLDKLEELLEHPQKDVYDFAIKLIDNYFDVEDGI